MNLVGRRFGKLMVQTENDSRCLCLCDCGNIKSIAKANLTRNKRGTKSCGCFHKSIVKKLGENNLIDLTGRRFGYLIVEKRIPNRNNSTYWRN